MPLLTNANAERKLTMEVVMDSTFYDSSVSRQRARNVDLRIGIQESWEA